MDSTHKAPGVGRDNVSVLDKDYIAAADGSMSVSDRPCVERAVEIPKDNSRNDLLDGKGLGVAVTNDDGGGRTDRGESRDRLLSLPLLCEANGYI